MSENSAIEWCDATWNPVLGCAKVSEGCRGCYAIPQAWMKQSNPGAKVREAYSGLVEKRPDGSLNWTGRVNLVPERLPLPLTWKKSKRIFVNSLSDLFHEAVPDEYIDRVFAVMALAQHHTFQVLTKRPERMAAYLKSATRANAIGSTAVTFAEDMGMEWDFYYSWGRRVDGIPCWPLPNVWLGVSVEETLGCAWRITELQRTPAAVRFVSAEPLIGPLDLSPYLGACRRCDGTGIMVIVYLRTNYGRCDVCQGTGRVSLDWVIAGGESGPRHRPLDLDWARSLRDQCVAAGVAFHFKQVGGRTPKANGRELDGRTWDEFPQIGGAS